MQWQISSIFFLTLAIWLSASCAPWRTWNTLAAWPREQTVSVLSSQALPDATDPVGFGSSAKWRKNSKIYPTPHVLTHQTPEPALSRRQGVADVPTELWQALVRHRRGPDLSYGIRNKLVASL